MRPRSFALTVGLVTAALAFVQCSSAPSAPGGPPADPAQTGPVTTSGVTFHKDISPILQKHCQGCHSTGGIAPFTLVTYDDAKTKAQIIVNETTQKRMPPWGADQSAACTPKHGWKNDNRLSPDELAKLGDWQKAGAPEGDPKDEPPPLSGIVTGLPAVEQTLATTGYTMASSTDVMRCFVLDPGLGAQKWMNGMNVVPGERGIVHHALLFADPKQEGLKNAKDAGGTDQYDCFGGPKIQSGALLGGWVPGSVPLELPANIGTPLAAGSHMILQIHYHADGKPPRADKTKIELRFTKDKPEYLATTRLIGNFRTQDPTTGDGLQPHGDGTVKFEIPAGDPDHSEVMKYTLPAQTALAGTVYLYAVSGHMHYVGVKEEVHLQHASDKSDECLLSIPRWDFDWQRGYAYDAPITGLPVLSAGDVLTVKCGYDNSPSNPKMSRILSEGGLTAPTTVTLGETTLDEMCLSGLTFVTKAQ